MLSFCNMNVSVLCPIEIVGWLYNLQLPTMKLSFLYLYSYQYSTMAATRNGRHLSTDTNKVDEPFKVEEAETVNVPPPPTEKVLHSEDCSLLWIFQSISLVVQILVHPWRWLICILTQLLVLGGNGFVGSHVCREALDRGLSVASLSRYKAFNPLNSFVGFPHRWFLSRWMQLLVPADAKEILNTIGLSVILGPMPF